MAATVTTRRSHGHVRWFDERLGESPAWSQYTKNTFIELEPDSDEAEERAALRREHSAPARALAPKEQVTEQDPEELEAARQQAARSAVEAAAQWALLTQAVGRSRERSFGRNRAGREGGCRGRGRSSGCSSGRSSGRSSRRSSHRRKVQNSGHLSKQRATFSVVETADRRHSIRRATCPALSGSVGKSRTRSDHSSGPSSRRSSVVLSGGSIYSRPTSIHSRAASSVASSRASSHRFSGRSSGRSTGRRYSGRGKSSLSAKAGRRLVGMRGSTSKQSESAMTCPPWETARGSDSHAVQQASTRRSNRASRSRKVSVQNRFAALEVDTADADAEIEETSQDEAGSSSSDSESDDREVETFSPQNTTMQSEESQISRHSAKSQSADSCKQEVDSLPAQHQVEPVPRKSKKPRRPVRVTSPKSPSSDGGQSHLKDSKDSQEQPSASSASSCAPFLSTTVEASSSSSHAATPEVETEVAMSEKVTDAQEKKSELFPSEEVPSGVSKSTRRRANKRAKKDVSEDTKDVNPAAAGLEEPCQVVKGHSADAPEVKDERKLTSSQAQALAELAVRLNEKNIALHLRGAGLRRMLLATPVDPPTIHGKDMLSVEPGDVIHCELTDGAGWGFGTIVAPLRLAGQQGCFSCETMRPIVVEVRSGGDGDTLEFTSGVWAEVAAGRNGFTKNRLREKLGSNRIKAACKAYASQAGI